jgi:hypothetical protein
MMVTYACVHLPFPALFLSCRSSAGPSICSPSSQQSYHSIYILPWFSPVLLASSSGLHTFYSLRSCHGFGGNPSGARLGIKTCLTWPSSLSLPQHHRTALCLLRLPPLANPLRAKAASHLCPRHGPAELSGSTF